MDSAFNTSSARMPYSTPVAPEIPMINLISGSLRALRAAAQPAQVLEAVDTGVMGVAEFEVDCVLPHELDLVKFEAVGNMNGKDDSLSRHFILTGRTGAEPPQKLGQVTRLVAVCPQDLQLVGGELLDLCGSGGVRGHAYSTSRTGNAAYDRMLTCAAIFLLISRRFFALSDCGC